MSENPIDPWTPAEWQQAVDMAAAAPAIAEPGAPAAEAFELKVGDVVTIANAGSWTVTAVFEAVPDIMYSIQRDGVYAIRGAAPPTSA